MLDTSVISAPPPILPKGEVFRSIDIPPRPALLMAVQHEMRKDDVNVTKLAQLINRDVAITGSLLATANSAYFALKRRVETVQDAIQMLGINEFGAVITRLVTRRTLGNGGMMMARFWDVSEKRATGMSWIARQMRVAAPEPAHNFGLFCDIGIPLLKAKVSGYVQTLTVANRHAGSAFLDTENMRHGMNHAHIGALLAEEWSIGSEIVLAIRTHHEHATLYDESVPHMARMLIALNYIVEKAIQAHRNQPHSLEWLEGGAAAMDVLGISEAEADQLSDAIKQKFRLPK